MTFKTHYGRLISFAALAATLAAAVAGCGGGTTNGDNLGSTPSAYPYIYAYQDNYTGVPTSGLGTGSTGVPASTGDPLTTDTFLFTFASSNSSPMNTLPGAGNFVTGIAAGEANLASGAPGVFALGVPIPAAAPGGSYVFRAEGVQGQVSHTVEDIKTAGITPPGGSFLSFDPAAVTAYSVANAAGPFKADSYVAHPVAIPASAGNTVVTIPATISDAAGHSTTTNFESVVLSPGDAAIASASKIALTGVTPIYTYGPDASGTTILIIPAGTYGGTIGGNPFTITTTDPTTGDAVTNTAATITLPAGTVTCE